MRFLATLDPLSGWALIVVGVLGLLVGSGLTRVIARLPQMMAHAWEADIADYRQETPPPPPRFHLGFPADHCLVCRQPLRLAEQLPLWSWFRQKGRCRACDAPISPMYPVVEGLTALLFVACVGVYGWQSYTLWAWVFCGVCVVLAGIDARTQLLPDTLTLGLLWLGLLVNLGSERVALADAVLGAVAGYLVLWTVYWSYRLLTGKEGMGQGDFKLFAALGAWFGWQALPWMMTLAAVAGVVIGGGVMLKKRRSLQEAMPFGPFLAASGCVQLLWGFPGLS